MVYLEIKGMQVGKMQNQTAQEGVRTNLVCEIPAVCEIPLPPEVETESSFCARKLRVLFE